MILIGESQKLRICRETPQGFYLTHDDDLDEEEEVLLPLSMARNDLELGDKLDVFVYVDSSGRDMATMERPYILVNEFAFLEVASISEIGAFCYMGISKDLFIPFQNQATELQEGKSYIVYMYHDRMSDRLVGTTKFKPYLKLEAEENLTVGKEVEILVQRQTDLGFAVIINDEYVGLVYKSEATQEVKIGDRLNAYILPLRADKKIDVSLSPVGYQHVTENSDAFLEYLKEHEGFVALNDKSDPHLIKAELDMSKKLFKKIIGTLYKQKLITISEEGVRLI